MVKTIDIADVEEEPPGARLNESGLSPVMAPQPETTDPSLDQWHDWTWQMRHRSRTASQLADAFPAFRADEHINRAAAIFPLAITPYYASLIRHWDTSDPVFRMSIPDAGELENAPCLEDDPLHEDHDMPVPGLVHRYTDRALLIATTACAMYCRHCTRKRVAGKREHAISKHDLDQAVSYLRQHPEIHDVIVSGGDPLTLPTASLEHILAALRGVESIEIIRIGTRTPVTLPMRITQELTDMLRRYHPLWINTHFNHPAEITPESREACARLVDAGIPMGNQSVLLRGVNDDPEIMAELCRSLVRMRVRPYYLFQCDLVRGVEHFRTPISRGIDIMEQLRGRLSGLAIPTFVVDAPGGGGKIPVLPTYLISSSPTATLLRNFEGKTVSYPEPLPRAVAGQEKVHGAGGLTGETGAAAAATDDRRHVNAAAACLIPAESARQ
ncbi:MAG: KamA family radical SAM protein [Lentisphaeria bacterium]|nr:KamA family radical SAM protein [Lentisphaeria bacterium]